MGNEILDNLNYETGRLTFKDVRYMTTGERSD